MNSTIKTKATLLLFKLSKIVLPAVIILLSWDIASLLTDNSFFMPSVKETFYAMYKIIINKNFLRVVFKSLYRITVGLLIGTLAGIFASTLCHFFELANVIISPLMSIIKATPVACIIVLLWISMDYSELTVFIVVMMVMPVVWQNLLDGFASISTELSEVADVFEITLRKRIQILIFPALLDYLIPALITSVGLAWKAEIAAEIMTNSNIGELIYNFKAVSYDTASVFAWTVIIVFLSICFEKATKKLLRRYQTCL